MKKAELELKKKLLGYASLVLASTVTLSGCGEKKEKNEYVSFANQENYDLLYNSFNYDKNHGKYRVLTIQKSDGYLEYRLVYMCNRRDYIKNHSEYELLNECYDDPNGAAYVDIFSDELVAIRTNLANYGIYYDYCISNVIEDFPAMNYAIEYYGIKESYTYEELYDMMQKLNSKHLSR